MVVSKSDDCRDQGFCYNTSTITVHPTPLDISHYPELLRLVEEVATTKKPRELKRDNKTVAVLSPAIAKNTEKWEKIRATFGSWSDLDADKLIADIHRWRQEGSRPATRP